MQFLPPDSQAHNESLYRLYSWLKHCATDRKFACWMTDGVIWIFLLPESFRPPYGFRNILCVTEMWTGVSFVCGGKSGRWEGLTTLQISCADCLELLGRPPPLPHGSYPGHYFRHFCTNRGTYFEYCRLILWILILELASWNRFCTQIF